jgi:hypothetical protein
VVKEGFFGREMRSIDCENAGGLESKRNTGRLKQRCKEAYNTRSEIFFAIFWMSPTHFTLAKENITMRMLASNSTYYIDYSIQKGDDGNIAITEPSI